MRVNVCERKNNYGTINKAVLSWEEVKDESYIP
jgi:hypothetical protein